MKRRRVGIYVFDEVEVLDMAGPFEVFSVSKDRRDRRLFDVVTIGSGDHLVAARGGLLMQPNATTSHDLNLDILLIPGGFGTREEMKVPAVRRWIIQQSTSIELLLSVCTGSLILGACGLLCGLEATTHYQAYDELRAVSPDTSVREGIKYVDTGKIITSAGISAGIEMSLHVVERLHGFATAERTARYMEYDWHKI